MNIEPQIQMVPLSEVPLGGFGVLELRDEAQVFIKASREEHPAQPVLLTTNVTSGTGVAGIALNYDGRDDETVAYLPTAQLSLWPNGGWIGSPLENAHVVARESQLLLASGGVYLPIPPRGEHGFRAQYCNLRTGEITTEPPENHGYAVRNWVIAVPGEDGIDRELLSL